MTDKAPNTATVKGREVVVKAVNETQITMMNRMSRLAAAKADMATVAQERGDKDSARQLIEEGLNISGQLLDGMQHLLVDPADQEWLVEMMLRGEIEMDDLQPIFSAAGDAAAAAEGKRPAKKAVRAR